MCATHHKHSFGQFPPDLRPHIGAKEEQGDLGPCYVGVFQESLFGELRATVATVSPGVQQDGRGSADELQVSRHGFHVHRPRAPGVTGHCGAARRTKTNPNEGQTEERCSPDGAANPPTNLLAHLKTLKQA